MTKVTFKQLKQKALEINRLLSGVRCTVSRSPYQETIIRVRVDNTLVGSYHTQDNADALGTMVNMAYQSANL